MAINKQMHVNYTLFPNVNALVYHVSSILNLG